MSNRLNASCTLTLFLSLCDEWPRLQSDADRRPSGLCWALAVNVITYRDLLMYQSETHVYDSCRVLDWTMFAAKQTFHLNTLINAGLDRFADAKSAPGRD